MRNRWAGEHQRGMRTDEDEKQELSVTLSPPKKMTISLCHRQQKNAEKTGNIVWRYPKLKEEKKKIYNLAFRNKFSMSFLLDLEDLM